MFQGIWPIKVADGGRGHRTCTGPVTLCSLNRVIGFIFLLDDLKRKSLVVVAWMNLNYQW